MSKNKFITLAVIVVILLIGITQTLYVVNEREQVVITQFGKPVGKAVTQAGIQFKVPFIQTVNVFEKRYMEWDGDPNQIPTKD